MKNIKIIILLLANIIAFGGAAQTDVSTTLRLWTTNPLEVVNDGRTISPLTFYENDVETYCAFNMEILVPEGLKIAKVKQGRDYVFDIKMSERATTTHSIACGQPNPGVIRVICTSSQNLTFYPDDEDGNPLDELYTIGLIAEPSLQEGTYELTVQDIKFVRPDVQAYIPEEPVKIQLVVKNSSSTGLNEIGVEEESATEFYDLQGRRVNTASPGIRISSDGNKILVR